MWEVKQHMRKTTLVVSVLLGVMAINVFLVGADDLKVKDAHSPFGLGEYCTSRVTVDGSLAAGVEEWSETLFYYDFQKKQRFETGISGASRGTASIKGSQIAYRQRVSGGWSGNYSISVYDIVTQSVKQTGITTASRLSYWDSSHYFDGQHIVYEDKVDGKVKIYSLSTGSVMDTGWIGWGPTIDGDYVTFEQQWNIILYQISTGQGAVIDTGFSPVVGGNLIAYLGSWWGELKYYRIDLGKVFSTGITRISSFSTDGERIVFEAYEDAISILDSKSGKVDVTGVYGCSGGNVCWLDISGKYITYERWEGGTEIRAEDGTWIEIYPPTDLNGDGAIGPECVAGWFKD